MAIAKHATLVTINPDNPSKEVSKNVWNADHIVTLGADENFVTAAQLVVIGNTSGTNTGDSAGHDGLALLAGRAGGQTLIGGTGTTDDLILRTTSGVGASGADMIFQTGNNGATEAIRILYNGNVGIGITAPTSRIHGVTTLSAATGDEVAYTLAYTTNKLTSGADTGLLIAMTDTASPGTSLPLNVTVDGVSKFRVSSSGAVTQSGDINMADTTGIRGSGSLWFAGLNSPSLVYFDAYTVYPQTVNQLSLGKSTRGWTKLYLNATNVETSGTHAVATIAQTYNQASGTAANTDFLINRTQTAVGSGAQLLIDAQVGGVSQWKASNVGNTTQVGSLTTGAPNTGTAGAWKLGTIVTGQVGLVLVTTQYIEVDIGGTLYKLATV